MIYLLCSNLDQVKNFHISFGLFLFSTISSSKKDFFCLAITCCLCILATLKLSQLVTTPESLAFDTVYYVLV